MIKIKYIPAQYSLIVQGHARSGEPGRDIVCAGVSALVYAIRSRGEGVYRAEDEKGVAGYARVSCHPREGEEALCREMLETGMEGLRAIAMVYPDFVSIEEMEHGDQ